MGTILSLDEYDNLLILLLPDLTTGIVSCNSCREWDKEEEQMV